MLEPGTFRIVTRPSRRSRYPTTCPFDESPVASVPNPAMSPWLLIAEAVGLVMPDGVISLN